MLAGLMRTGESMFPSIAGPMAPDIEDVERARLEALYRKTIRLSTFTSETFDLSDSNSNKQYMKRMLNLFSGVQAKTHVILAQDRRFVDNREKAGWLVHLEWAEYELNVEPNDVTMPNNGAAHG